MPVKSLAAPRERCLLIKGFPSDFFLKNKGQFSHLRSSPRCRCRSGPYLAAFGFTENVIKPQAVCGWSGAPDSLPGQERVGLRKRLFGVVQGVRRCHGTRLVPALLPELDDPSQASSSWASSARGFSSQRSVCPCGPGRVPALLRGRAVPASDEHLAAPGRLVPSASAGRLGQRSTGRAARKCP